MVILITVDLMQSKLRFWLIIVGKVQVDQDPDPEAAKGNLVGLCMFAFLCVFLRVFCEQLALWYRG